MAAGLVAGLVAVGFAAASGIVLVDDRHYRLGVERFAAVALLVPMFAIGLLTRVTPCVATA